MIIKAETLIRVILKPRDTFWAISMEIQRGCRNNFYYFHNELDYEKQESPAVMAIDEEQTNE